MKNIPITIGSARSGRIQLPSYNEMTAGKRLVDYGRRQGLDIPEMGSVSPGEAQFMVQQGLAKRQQAPLGMDVAQQFLIPQEGETPEVMATRAMIARMPASGIPTLLGHLATLPGFGTKTDTAMFSGLYGPAGPAPGPSPAVPSEGTSRPAAGTAGGPPPTPQPQLPAAPGGIAAPPAPGPAVPSTAPLARPQLPPPPAEPPAPSLEVTEAQAQADPDVQVARGLALRNPYDATLRQKWAQAYATAGERILKQRQQQYMVDTKNWSERMQAWKAQREASLPNWPGVPAEMKFQLLIDGHDIAPGSQPTSAQINASYPNMVARLNREEAAKAGTVKSATMTAEQQTREGLPLIDAVGGDPAKANAWRDPSTGLPPTDNQMPYGAIKQRYVQVVGDNEKHLDALLNAMPMVQKINEMTQHLYGPGGIYEKLTPDERTNLGKVGTRAFAQLMQDHPELKAMRDYIETFAEPLARAIGGVRGAGTEGDVERARAAFAQVAETFGVQMKGFIPSFSWNRPDTRAVAITKLNNYNQTLDRMGATLLRNPAFQFAGLLPRLTPQQVQAEQQRTSGAIGPYRPEIGPQGMTPEQLQATPRRPPTPQQPGAVLTTRQPKGLSPADAMRQVTQTSLRQHGLTQPPNPQTQPAEFKAFLNTVRQQIGNYLPRKTPQEQDALTSILAQRLGGTWP